MARPSHWQRWAAAFALVVGAAVAIPFGLGAPHEWHETAPSNPSVANANAPHSNPIVPTGVGDVAHLTVKLRSAITRAIAAAQAEGVEVRVTSGYRSEARQQQLYEEAIGKYGSPEQARQWVLPPNESAHVRGEAVDVGPALGAAWLREHGERFGLCQRYANESWHFERLAGVKGSSCPDIEAHA